MKKLTEKQMRYWGRKQMETGRYYLTTPGKRQQGFYLLQAGRTLLLKAEILKKKRKKK